MSLTLIIIIKKLIVWKLIKQAKYVHILQLIITITIDIFQLTIILLTIEIHFK